MNLDALYGQCLEPGSAHSEYEENNQPQSRQLLNDATAKHLKEYLDCKHPLSLINLVPQVCHILWLMDERGDIWFAVEEVILPHKAGGGFDTIGILNKAFAARPDRDNYVKLGHPSLLEKGELNARIGGEIVYDPGDGHDWCVTNDSGRYGTRKGTTKAMLIAVVEKFKEFGLYFEHDFVPPAK